MISLVERETAQVVEENQLPQVFRETVEWDILHVGMEAEYADAYQPGFLAGQADEAISERAYGIASPPAAARNDGRFLGRAPTVEDALDVAVDAVP